MGLSPEERRKIYEEEKARIEAREQLEQEKKAGSTETGTGLQPNAASILCYLGGWITGIIFFIIEQKNRMVRFHAAQSIIVFGSLTVAGSLLDLIPVVGQAFSTIVWIIAFILWIILMVKAASGEVLRLGWFAETADRMVGSRAFTPDSETAVSEKGSVITTSAPVASVTERPRPVDGKSVSASAEDLDKVIERKVDEFLNRSRAGRIAGSAFAIAFSIAALIFFNYFYDYIAFYSSDKVGAVTVWTRAPFFTDDIRYWLPVLTAALFVNIVAHIILIIYDKYVLRELLMTVVDCFSLASVVTLVTVFPFDFSVIPDVSVGNWVEISVRITLILVSVGIGIGVLARLIRFLINLLRGTATYRT